MSTFETAWARHAPALTSTLGDSATWYHDSISESIAVILDEEFLAIPAGEVDVWGRDLRVLTSAEVRPRDEIKIGEIVYSVSDVIEFGDMYEAILER